MSKLCWLYCVEDEKKVEVLKVRRRKLPRESGCCRRKEDKGPEGSVTKEQSLFAMSQLASRTGKPWLYRVEIGSKARQEMCVFVCETARQTASDSVDVSFACLSAAACITTKNSPEASTRQHSKCHAHKSGEQSEGLK